MIFCFIHAIHAAGQRHKNRTYRRKCQYQSGSQQSQVEADERKDARPIRPRHQIPNPPDSPADSRPY